MKRFKLMLVMAPLAAFILAPSLQAQGPPGMNNMPPEVQARMKAWRTFRDTHKNISAIQQTLSGFNEMEKDAKTQLTKPQAKTVLATLKAWRKKPTMSDAQALKVNKQITAQLSVPQLKKIATAPRFGRRGGQGGGNRGPGGPGAGGAPGAGGGQRQFDPSRFPEPREYNPLNPESIPMERQRTATKAMLDGLTKRLAARAK